MIMTENLNKSLEILLGLNFTPSMVIYLFTLWFFISVNVVDGEVLFITKVSRLHMAVYLCIASNGVPPSISKRIQLKVQCKYYILVKNNNAK